ncbi:NAD-dependent epimerase/dehydratase family protein [Mucilaginibacter myungsuensis]|uniref:NAD-dependent epimerase/dehydratase family protein n=1 Tax=Mucilaginibacter myungsuensis TaxID=649104 RepID=A0A929KY37_9SPHI|nr:NAD-dependent epimerase/dehydratase family protein [Mucilaginibacter myungsuensis]MBE9662048.1 NAD-dependent epimerase/dehydratase family protein [Mucilaginibacter myungsuensis]MDN3599519.1 NAD-dependent epimerase/dehydratase family protein [Mucilaginibacter myungsuensis]
MILVTGATGFLGSELVMQLASAGHSVRCIKRASSVVPVFLDPYKNNIEWVDADLLNYPALEDAFEGVTQVYHCAAWVSLMQKDRDAMISTNVNGTANVVNLCSLNNARLVHVSSVAAIGDAKPGQMITEEHHLDPGLMHDGYATSKLESEMEVWRGIAEGLDAVIVNPSIIIGPNAGIEGSGRLFHIVKKGLKFYTRGTIGFVDVQDVAKTMILLMDSGISEQRFIVSAENRDYKSVVTEAANCFGIPAPQTESKPWMMEVAWRAAAFWAAITGGIPAIDKVSAQSASITRNYDSSKLHKAIDIQFKPISKAIVEVCEGLKA